MLKLSGQIIIVWSLPFFSSPVLASGESAAVERQLEKPIAFGRHIICTYWVGILMVAFLGTIKPF